MGRSKSSLPLAPPPGKPAALLAVPMAAGSSLTGTAADQRGRAADTSFDAFLAQQLDDLYSRLLKEHARRMSSHSVHAGANANDDSALRSREPVGDDAALEGEVVQQSGHALRKGSDQPKIQLVAISSVRPLAAQDRAPESVDNMLEDDDVDYPDTPKDVLPPPFSAASAESAPVMAEAPLEIIGVGPTKRVLPAGNLRLLRKALSAPAAALLGGGKEEQEQKQQDLPSVAADATADEQEILSPALSVQPVSPSKQVRVSSLVQVFDQEVDIDAKVMPVEIDIEAGESVTLSPKFCEGPGKRAALVQDAASDYDDKAMTEVSEPVEVSEPPVSSRSMDNEDEFHLLDFWKEEMDAVRSAARNRLSRSRTSLSLSDARSVASRKTSDTMSDDENAVPESWLERTVGTKFHKLVVHPNTKRRLCWELIGMVLIAYDIVWTPLQTFDPPTNIFTSVVDWIHIFYWSIDMPTSFFVGFFHDGKLITNIVKVAKRYLKTWFPLDILLISMDWCIVILEEDVSENELGAAGLVRVGKTVRIIKLLRIFRLLRLLKLRQYFLQVEERIQSRAVLVILGICKLTLMILVINHFIACLWWLVGTTDPGEGYTNWVDAHESGNLRMERLDYRYTTSLHWSLTQFTPAGMEVYARNPLERLTSIIVLVFALVTFSSFVSSITNAMNDLRNINSEHERQLIVFQRFIRSRKISTELSIRMRRHLEHKLVRKNGTVEEQDVELLKLMSEPLRMELHMEVYMQVLDAHPFFLKFSETYVTGIRMLCHTAIEETSMSRRDLLFSAGDIASRVFFVRRGALCYMLRDRTVVETVQPCTPADPQWLCEACLWTEWLCLGEALAQERSVVLSLSAQKFREVVRANQGRVLRPVQYAEQYVRHLNSMGEDDRTDLRPSIDLMDSFDEAVAVQQAMQVADCTWVSTGALSTRSTGSKERSQPAAARRKPRTETYISTQSGVSWASSRL